MFHHQMTDSDKRVEKTTRSGVFLTNFEVKDSCQILDITSQTTAAQTK